MKLKAPIVGVTVNNFPKNPPVLQVLGTLFNNQFNNIGLNCNGYLQTGSGAFTAIGNAEITSVAASVPSIIYDNRIDFVNYGKTCLEDYTHIVEFKVTSRITNGSFGFGIYRYGREILASIEMSGGANDGQLKLYEYTVANVTSGSNLVYSVGDRIRLTVLRVKNVVTYTAYNVTTTSSTVSCTYTYDQITHYVSSRGYWCICNLGGSYTVYIHSASSVQNKNIKTIITGDSISVGGSSSPTITNRYYTKLSIASTISADLSGGGDGTQFTLESIQELLVVNATYYVLMIGGNDIAFGVLTSDQWKAYYSAIVSRLKAAGKNVIHCTPTPRNSSDMTPLRSFINVTFTSDIIVDTYTALWSGSGTGLNALYDSGDGVHPNNAGHTLIANTILANASQIV
jgi:lysophospholipase L1-like esterase